MKALYQHVYNKIQSLGETPKEILSNLKKPENEDFITLIKILYDENSLEGLAIKLKRQQEYYQKTADINYLVDSQPDSQKAYWDKETSSHSVWKKTASIGLQSTISIHLFPQETKYIVKFFNDLSDPQASSMREKFLEAIEVTFSIYRDRKTEHHLENAFSALCSSKDPDKEIDIQHLTKTEAFLFNKAKLALQSLAWISHQYNPIGKPIQLRLPGIEFEVLSHILSSHNDTKSTAATAFKKEKKSNKALWSITAHGQAKDQQYTIAGPDQSIRIFPKDGILYDVNTGQTPPTLASTHKMRMKNHPGIAGLVINLDGQIHLFNHDFGTEVGAKKFHSLVTGGKPVMFAGGIIVTDGKVKSILPYSGHYQPAYTFELLLLLSEKGLLNKNIDFHGVGDGLALLKKLVKSDSGKEYLSRYIKLHGKPGFQKLQKIAQTVSYIPNQSDKIMRDIFTTSVYPTLIHDTIENPLIQWDSTFELLDLKDSETYRTLKNPETLIPLIKHALKSQGNCAEKFEKLPAYSQAFLIKSIEHIPPLEQASLCDKIKYLEKYGQYYYEDVLFKAYKTNEKFSTEELISACELLETTDLKPSSFHPPARRLMIDIGLNLLKHPKLAPVEKLYYLDLYQKYDKPILESLKYYDSARLLENIINELPFFERIWTKARRLFGIQNYKHLYYKKIPRASLRSPNAQPAEIPSPIKLGPRSINQNQTRSSRP